MVAAGLSTGSLAASRAAPRAQAAPSLAGGRRTALLGSRSKVSSTTGLRGAARPAARSRGFKASSSGKIYASGEKQWEVTVASTAVLEEDDEAGQNFEFEVLDQVSDAKSNAISLDALKWDKQPKEGLDGLVRGWSKKGSVALPATIGTPGALLITKKDKKGAKVVSLDYISTVTLKGDGKEYIFPVHSWISADHGKRVFFQGKAFLPKDTPPAVAAARTAELAALKGAGPKKKSDRVYGWQIYDDLDKGGRLKGDEKLYRPPLGGSAKLPYPRHLANLKAEGETGCGTPWVPFDEEFGFLKEQGFKGDALLGKVNALVGLLAAKLELRDSFKNFEDVYEVFKPNGGWDADLNEKEVLSVVSTPKAAAVGGSSSAQSDPNLLTLGGYMVGKALKSLKDGLKQQDISIKFNEPRVLAGRKTAWDTDEEAGRQFVAGLNPCTLTALKELPIGRGSAISPAHVNAELKALGAPSMEELIKQAAAGQKPRLFISDYWFLNHFWDEKKEDSPSRAEHLGRALVFLHQVDGKDVAMLPLAIELAHRKTHEENPGLPKSAGIVYSRQELGHDPKKKALWRLAKAVFKSLDLSQHQLISHWLRCHACIEPFIVSLHRNVSAMHPVYKLMNPHFRYTLDINARGRGVLANAGGFIESAFTPGEYNMRLTAAAYTFWRFKDQALPTDLKNRGTVDSTGKPWFDYPYAEDGLDIWNAYSSYFNDYLRLYYKSDADVLGDTELQAWWDEAKKVGHEDTKYFETDEVKVWGFAGPIPSIDKLVHILTTIAWTTSVHHTAVNFSQYDYSGLLLNASCQVRRRIPSPIDTESAAYKALVNAPSEAKLEEEYLTYLGDQKVTLKNCVTMSVLSTHSEDEHFIDQPNTLLTDPEAKALNEKFIKKTKELEAAFKARDKDPSKWTRGAGKAKGSLEYTQLYPSSPPGLTSRGVPYSVSI